MRFLIDECTGPKVAAWLRNRNHEVLSVYDELRGADDTSILNKALNENYILITNDKDFGELVYHQGLNHKGIILLRLENDKVENKIAVIEKILEKYSDQIVDHFIVASERMIRIS